MKKALFSALCVMLCASANASDGGLYYETNETRKDYVSYNYDVVTYVDTPAMPVARPAAARPCPMRGGEPVRVKTHTEVVDHYQLYQPVTVYEPAGEYVEYRVVAEPKPCNRCNRF